MKHVDIFDNRGEEISWVVGCRETEDGDVEVVMLEYVSPIEWGNAVLYGQCVVAHAPPSAQVAQVRAESDGKKEGDP
jgi:hypothetical protein